MWGFFFVFFLFLFFEKKKKSSRQKVWNISYSEFERFYIILTVCLWGFRLEGQEPRARLCCRKYLTPCFGYIILPHVDWPAECLAQESPKRIIQKRQKQIRDENISSILSFIYWVQQPLRRWGSFSWIHWNGWIPQLSFLFYACVIPFSCYGPSGSFCKFKFSFYLFIFIFIFIYLFFLNLIKKKIIYLFVPYMLYVWLFIMSRLQHGYPWSSLATSPYHSSPPARLQGYILCPHIVAVSSCWSSCFCTSICGAHRSTSLMSSSLLLQQCPACLVHLTCIVFVMGGEYKNI